MKFALLLLSSVAIIHLAPAAEPAPLVLERTIPLGRVNGRIDHLSVDLGRRRLHVAELGNDSVGVVDLASASLLRTLTGLREPQGILYVAASDELFVANGRDGSVSVFHGPDLAPAGVIHLGDDADNLRLARSGHIVVAGHGSGGLALIESSSHRLLADITLPAHPEGFQISPDGQRAYVNIPQRREIAVIDMVQQRQIATWPVTGTRANFPLTLESRTDAPWSVFRDPPRLVRFGPDGKSTLMLETCGDSDDLFFDERRHRVYVICGSGQIDVFEQRGQQYVQVARIATVPGARTGLFVPELDRLFVAARSTSKQSAAVLVFRPVDGALRP